MSVFYRCVSWLTRAGAVLAVVALVFICLLIGTEITLRTLLNSSTHMADELVGYAVAAMTFLGLGYALEHKALIRVNLVLANLDAGGRARWILELLCCAFGLFATGLASVFFFQSALRKYERGYISETIAEVPLWIPEAALLLGLGIFWLTLLAYTLRVLRREESLATERAVDLGFE